MVGARWLATCVLLVGCAKPPTVPGFLPPPAPEALAIDSEDSFWGDPPSALLPELPPDIRTPAIRITSVPARRGEDPTAAVLGRIRVLPDQGARYAGQPLYATVVGAVDVETAEVYAAAVQRIGGHDAWTPDLTAQPPASDLVSSGTQFGIDLRQHLRLPARRATYDVFVWIDGETDGPHRVEVPASGKASMTPGRTVVVDASEPAAGEAPAEGLHPLEGTRVRGRLPREGVLVAFAIPTQRIAIARVPATFDLDLLRLFTRPPSTGHVWAVALADGRLTRPLRVELSAP